MSAAWHSSLRSPPVHSVRESMLWLQPAHPAFRIVSFSTLFAGCARPAATLWHFRRVVRMAGELGRDSID